MRSFKAEGIVIKRRNYGEADRLITVLTRYHGKLQIRASGVRKITSRRSAHIELLNHANLHLHVAKTLPILTEAESLDDFAAIKSDLSKVGFAYHLCELVDGLCPEGQDQRQVFSLLLKTLQDLGGLSSTELVPHAFPDEAEVQNDRLGEDLSPRVRNDNIVSDGGSMAVIIHSFEIELLSLLGYWQGKPEMAAALDTHNFIENIIEKRLKSKKIFATFSE